MSSREAWRWAGSIGIFYVLVPLALLTSDPVLASALPRIPGGWFPRWTAAAFVVAGLGFDWESRPVATRPGLFPFRSE